MFTSLRYITLIFSIVLLAACSGEDYSKFQRLLNENKALWESHQLDNYAFVYERFCYCSPSYNASLVVDGEVVRSYDKLEKQFHPDDELENFSTVEYYFTLIQHAIDRKADALEVVFNEEFGYPEYVYVDFDFGIADEEIAYKVHDFNSSGHTEVEYYLGIAKDTWDKEYYTDYTFNYSVSCFCAVLFQNANVEVVDGVVTAATDENGQPISEQDLASIPTVDELFGYIQQWIDDEADALEVQFDEMTGFPLLIDADVQVGASDDEFTYELSAFDPNYLTSNQNKLDANSELWAEEGRPSYHYVVETEETGDLREYWITVVNNAATDAHYHEGSAETDIDPNAVLDYPTLTDYFELIQDSINLPADIIIVEYSERKGYPKLIFIDPDATVAGDELEYSIQLYL